MGRNIAEALARVAGRAAALPGFPLSRHTDTAAIGRARGDPDLKAVGFHLPGQAVAGLQGNGTQRTLHGFLQGDEDVPFDITAPPGTGGSRLTEIRGLLVRKSVAAATAEVLLEEVAETRPAKMELLVRPARPAMARRRGKAFMLPVGTKAIVFFALFRITEDLVGLVDFLELRLRSRPVLGDVRMVFAGQFAECFFDIILTGLAGNPQRGIIIFEFSGHRLWGA